MDTKIFSIPFIVRSAKSDYACPDGEIAAAVNMRFNNGSLQADNRGAANRLPPIIDSPFIDGELQKPPLPEVEFALLKSVVEGWHIHSDMLPSKIMDAPATGKDDNPTEHDWGTRAMEALGDFETTATGQNLFIHPFFVMSAYRLADGSHLCPSPPILMIPNSGAPMIAGSADYNVATMQMSIVAAACRLQWRIKMPELPEEWHRRITHLNIFVSLPVALYDPKGGTKGYHRVECKNFTHCIDASGNADEHRIHSSQILQCWQPSPIDDATVTKNILQTDSFFLISELPLDSLSTLTDFENVTFNRGGLPILTSMEIYTPDFAHLSDVTAGGHTLFSGRITAWDLKLTPPAPLPLPLSTPYSNTSANTPRWVFHPDPYAGRYPYTWGSSSYSLPLRRHPKMKGSFYWRGFATSASPNEELTVIQDSISEQPTLNLPGGVWRSAKGRYRLFPDNGQMMLHVRQIIAICRAFRASGLVATTAPTAYAFTSEGVFLLKEMEDGTFRDAGLICAYRLRDASSLELLPTGIRFVTDEGEVIVIEGTKVAPCDEVEAVSEEDDSWKEFIPEEWGGGDVDSMAFSNRGVFVTRPLKLGNAEGRKRLRAVCIRGSHIPDEIYVAIYGSSNLTKWTRLVLTNRAILSGLWAPSCRFFRVAIMLPLQSEVCLDGIAIKVATQ